MAVLWHSEAVLPGACRLPHALCAEGYSERLQPQEVAGISICNPFSNTLLVSARELTVLLSKFHLFISPGTSVHAISLDSLQLADFSVFTQWSLCTAHP